MGGRGARFGRSAGTRNNPDGNEYGSQYRTIKVKGAGNIKFVEATNEQSESLMETMTRGRVYVIIKNEKIKKIVYFDDENRRSKVIEFDHSHGKIKPHTHHGYFHAEDEESKIGASNLTTKEKTMVDKAKELWYNHRNRA